MENIKVLIDGIQKDVNGIFYIYDSKYYFIYTEKEVDENNYVILYMTQVGKETKNTENGLIDTGYMIGVEITDPIEQQKIQTSISYIVEDKKNNTLNPEIQYLPMSMLTNLKIVSKKRFRLLKSIMVDNFKLQFNDSQISGIQNIAETANMNYVNQVSNVVNPPIIEPVVESVVPMNVVTSVDTQELQPLPEINENNTVGINAGVGDSNIIVDYKTKYFEEEEKNKELQAQIEILMQKLDQIKNIIE